MPWPVPPVGFPPIQTARGPNERLVQRLGGEPTAWAPRHHGSGDRTGVRGEPHEGWEAGGGGGATSGPKNTGPHDKSRKMGENSTAEGSSFKACHAAMNSSLRLLQNTKIKRFVNINAPSVIYNLGCNVFHQHPRLPF